MKKIRSILLVLVILGVGLGFYRGWFAATESREVLTNKIDVKLSVDPDKMKADVNLLKEDVHKVEQKAVELEEKAKNAVHPQKK